MRRIDLLALAAAVAAIAAGACGDNIHPGANVDAGPGAPARITTTITPDPVTAGQTATATCTVVDDQGNPLPADGATVTVAPDDPANTLTGFTDLMTKAGAYTGQCHLGTIAGNAAAFTVVPALPASLKLAASPAMNVYGVDVPITISHMVFDRYGNAIDTAVVTTQSTPVVGTGPTAEPSTDVYSYGGEGQFRIDGTVTPPTDNDQPVTASLMLVVDEFGPSITCDSDGITVNATPGSMLDVTGSVTDINGVMGVTVNGAAATLNGSAWSAPTATRYGINDYEIVATDAFGATNTKTCTVLVANQWITEGTSSADTVTLSLAQAAVDDGTRTGSINSLGDMLYDVLNSSGLATTLNTTLTADNPLKPLSCDDNVCVFGLCACLYSSEVRYLGSSLPGANTVSLTLVAGGLKTHVHIPNVGLDLRVNGAVSGIGYDTSGWVTVGYIDIDLTFDLAVASGAPHITVRPGSVSASVGTISTSFSGVDGWIIDNIVVPLAQGSLKTTVQNAITGFVQNNFNSVLDGVVSSISVSSLGSTFNVPRLDGTGTIAMAFDVGFSSLGVTTTRARFGLGTEFSAPATVTLPVLGIPEPPGAVISDPTITLPATTAVAAHVAVVQEALFALWRGGLFDATLSGTTLGLGASTTIGLAAKLPPVLDVNANGSVELELGAVDVTLTGTTIPDGTIVRVGVDAHASVSLTGNALTFGGLTLDNLYVSLQGANLSVMEQTALTTILTTAFQTVLTTSLNGALPALPIPSFTLPASVSTYGLPGGSSVGLTSPVLTVAPEHFTLRGDFGVF